MKRFAMTLPLFALLAGAACSERPAGCAGDPPVVDSNSAWAYAVKNASIPGRFVGSEANRKALEAIRAQAEALLRGVPGAICRLSSGVQEKTAVPFSNLICEIPGPGSDFLLVGAHHDAKKLLTVPDFQGANDGASGVGALLAMIKAVAERARTGTLPIGFRFVFFDGEEALIDYSETDGFLGSRHEAALMKRDGSLRFCRAMILLDMIGDRDLHVDHKSVADALLQIIAAVIGTELHALKTNVVEHPIRPLRDSSSSCPSAPRDTCRR